MYIAEEDTKAGIKKKRFSISIVLTGMMKRTAGIGKHVGISIGVRSMDNRRSEHGYGSLFYVGLV